jgi:transcriptional regulator with XRE-family HTH domain
MNDPVIIEARRMLLAYLNELAKEKKLSTYKIAEMTGITQSNVYRILNGRYPPTLDTFLLLCQKLDCYIFIVDKNAEDDLVDKMKQRWRRSFDES